MCRTPYTASGGQRGEDWISAGWCQLGDDLNTIPTIGLFSGNFRRLDVHLHIAKEKSRGQQTGRCSKRDTEKKEKEIKQQVKKKGG